MRIKRATHKRFGEYHTVQGLCTIEEAIFAARYPGRVAKHQDMSFAKDACDKMRNKSLARMRVNLIDPHNEQHLPSPDKINIIKGRTYFYPMMYVAKGGMESDSDSQLTTLGESQALGDDTPSPYGEGYGAYVDRGSQPFLPDSLMRSPSSQTPSSSQKPSSSRKPSPLNPSKKRKEPERTLISRRLNFIEEKGNTFWDKATAVNHLLASLDLLSNPFDIRRLHTPESRARARANSVLEVNAPDQTPRRTTRARSGTRPGAQGSTPTQQGIPRGTPGSTPQGRTPPQAGGVSTSHANFKKHFMGPAYPLYRIASDMSHDFKSSGIPADFQPLITQHSLHEPTFVAKVIATNPDTYDNLYVLDYEEDIDQFDKRALLKNDNPNPNDHQLNTIVCDMPLGQEIHRDFDKVCHLSKFKEDNTGERPQKLLARKYTLANFIDPLQVTGTVEYLGKTKAARESNTSDYVDQVINKVVHKFFHTIFNDLLDNNNFIRAHIVRLMGNISLPIPEIHDMRLVNKCSYTFNVDLNGFRHKDVNFHTFSIVNIKDDRSDFSKFVDKALRTYMGTRIPPSIKKFYRMCFKGLGDHIQLHELVHLAKEITNNGYNIPNKETLPNAFQTSLALRTIAFATNDQILFADCMNTHAVTDAKTCMAASLHLFFINRSEKYLPNQIPDYTPQLIFENQTNKFKVSTVRKKLFFFSTDRFAPTSDKNFGKETLLLSLVPKLKFYTAITQDMYDLATTQNIQHPWIFRQTLTVVYSLLEICNDRDRELTVAREELELARAQPQSSADQSVNNQAQRTALMKLNNALAATAVYLINETLYNTDGQQLVVNDSTDPRDIYVAQNRSLYKSLYLGYHSDTGLQDIDLRNALIRTRLVATCDFLFELMRQVHNTLTHRLNIIGDMNVWNGGDGLKGIHSVLRALTAFRDTMLDIITGHHTDLHGLLHPPPGTANRRTAMLAARAKAENVASSLIDQQMAIFEEDIRRPLEELDFYFGYDFKAHQDDFNIALNSVDTFARTTIKDELWDGVANDEEPDNPLMLKNPDNDTIVTASVFDKIDMTHIFNRDAYVSACEAQLTTLRISVTPNLFDGVCINRTLHAHVSALGNIRKGEFVSFYKTLCDSSHFVPNSGAMPDDIARRTERRTMKMNTIRGKHPALFDNI